MMTIFLTCCQGRSKKRKIMGSCLVSTVLSSRTVYTERTNQQSQGDFLYRRHSEPRDQLFVQKEETFPTPLKYMDVTRSTHTDLDVMQEKRTDDYWNVDTNRSLLASWKGFTNFTLLKEENPKGKR